MAILDWVKDKLGIGKINLQQPMKKGATYRLIFKYWGNLSPERADKITNNLTTRLEKDLKVTKVVFDKPEQGKLIVEGIALHDPIPFLLIGGLVGGIALLFGLRLALQEVYKVLNIFTPNKIILLCLLIGVPLLIFTGRINVKGLKVKGVK